MSRPLERVRQGALDRTSLALWICSRGQVCRASSSAGGIVQHRCASSCKRRACRETLVCAFSWSRPQRVDMAGPEEDEAERSL